MYGAYGRFQLADTYGGGKGGGKLIACIGDMSTHGGVIILHNQDGTGEAGDEKIAVEDPNQVLLQHRCAISSHGVGGLTTIKAITVKSFHNGKLILTGGAICSCGARIAPPNRRVYVE